MHRCDSLEGMNLSPERQNLPLPAQGMCQQVTTIGMMHSCLLRTQENLEFKVRQAT